MRFKICCCCYCTDEALEGSAYNKPTILPRLVLEQPIFRLAKRSQGIDPKESHNVNAVDQKESKTVHKVDPKEFAEECLKEHNKYRSMHGVPPLVNSPHLCEFATEWANYMAQNDEYEHRPNNKYGENLHCGYGMTAKKAVREFYEEIFLYDYDSPKFEKATGHFTQVIWRDTREMGTGIAQVGDEIWIVCNYHPPGNYSDEFDDEHVPRLVWGKCDNINLTK